MKSRAAAVQRTLLVNIECDRNTFGLVGSQHIVTAEMDMKAHCICHHCGLYVYLFGPLGEGVQLTHLAGLSHQPHKRQRRGAQTRRNVCHKQRAVSRGGTAAICSHDR